MEGFRGISDNTEWMDDSTLELAQEYIERHNEGVRSKDFAPLLELFAENAEMIFHSASIGTLIGRKVISDAFKYEPPDDELLVLGLGADDLGVEIRYAWKNAPTVPAGVLEFHSHDGKITRLVVC